MRRFRHRARGGTVLLLWLSPLVGNITATAAGSSSVAAKPSATADTGLGRKYRHRNPAEARIVRLSDKDVATIYVHPGGSILSFPTKPSKVVLGREGQFDVQYIERDVAIVGLTPNADANAFVYLLGRRYAFHLTVAPGKGERIIVVFDPEGDQFEVDVK